MNMTLEKTLYEISDLNPKLGGDYFFQQPVHKSVLELDTYFNTVANSDFLIGLEGNETYFLSKSVSEDIVYMFKDFLEENDTVIAQQQDTNIIYVGADQKIYAALAGDNKHILADTLSDFFMAILIIQKLLLKDEISKFHNNLNYKEEIISQIKEELTFQIKDPDYFVEFFYR